MVLSKRTIMAQTRYDPRKGCDMYVLANLNDDQVARVKRFEEQNGLQVLAFSDVPLKPAAVDAELLGELENLERELGCCLVAVS